MGKALSVAIQVGCLLLGLQIAHWAWQVTLHDQSVGAIVFLLFVVVGIWLGKMVGDWFASRDQPPTD